MRLVIRALSLLMCAVLLAACGGDGGEESPDEAVPTAQSTPATPPVQLTLSPPAWAESVDEDTGAPDEMVDQFTTESPAIYVLIEAENVPAGTTFTATWTINDAPIDDARMQVEATGDMPHAWIAFSFTRADGQLYPVGTLGVTITVSNGEVIVDSIEIGFP